MLLITDNFKMFETEEGENLNVQFQQIYNDDIKYFLETNDIVKWDCQKDLVNEFKINVNYEFKEENRYDKFFGVRLQCHDKMIWFDNINNKFFYVFCR